MKRLPGMITLTVRSRVGVKVKVGMKVKVRAGVRVRVRVRLRVRVRARARAQAQVLAIRSISQSIGEHWQSSSGVRLNLLPRGQQRALAERLGRELGIW